MLTVPSHPAHSNDVPLNLGQALDAASVSGLGASAGANSVQTISVLHVINGEHFSGAERVQQNLGLHLEQFGYTSHFVCVKPDKFPQVSGLPAERVHTAAMRSRFDWRAVDRVCDLVQETNSFLLHAHTPRTALVAAFAAHRMQLPWIYHVHSPAARDSTRGLVNRINDWVERFSIVSCDLLITVSRSLRREMLKRGVRRERLMAIPNGVAAIDPIDPSTRAQSRSWRLGLIALMRPRKGVEVALEAMARLKSQGAAVSLDLIGGFETPGYEAAIRKLISEWELEDVVQLKGFTRDVPTAVRELDALLLPSLFGEGMPMVVLEALSAGVPVVATRVEGTPEVVRHGVEGYLAIPRDAADIALQIQAMCASRQRWIAMSQAALARHRARFSDVEMARRVARAYDRIV